MNTVIKRMLTIMFITTLLHGCSAWEYDPLAYFQEVGLGKASYEFGCARQDLDVVSLGGASYGVIGCGKKAVYVGPSEGSFIRSSEIEAIK